MNPEQWLSLKWNGGSTMSDRWLNQSKIIHSLRSVRKSVLIYETIILGSDERFGYENATAIAYALKELKLIIK